LKIGQYEYSNISQGMAMRFSCGRIINNDFVTNLLFSSFAKKNENQSIFDAVTMDHFYPK